MVELVVQIELERTGAVVGERDVEDQPVAGVEAVGININKADELGAVFDKLGGDELALRRKDRAAGVCRGGAGRGHRRAGEIQRAAGQRSVVAGGVGSVGSILHGGVRTVGIVGAPENAERASGRQRSRFDVAGLVVADAAGQVVLIDECDHGRRNERHIARTVGAPAYAERFVVYRVAGIVVGVLEVRRRDVECVVERIVAVHRR